MACSSHSGPSSTTVKLNALVARIQANDSRAFDEFLHVAQSRLRRLTSTMFHRYPEYWGNEAEDILQDALVKIWKKFVSKKIVVTSTKEFLSLVAIHIRWALGEMARRSRADHVPLGSESSSKNAIKTACATGDSSDPQILALWTEIHELADQLEGREREAFDLKFYCNLSSAESAHILGVSKRTFQKWFLDARRTLARKASLLTDQGEFG